MKRIYNLKKQTPDERDFKLKALLNVHAAVKIPKAVDLRHLCPPVFDQLTLGTCTSNCGVGARMMLDNEKIMLSRLFQYYEERSIEGDINTDGGAQMRDIGKAMSTYGVCIEADYPYDITKFKNKPTAAALKNALVYKVKSYYSVPDVDSIKQVIALKQQPVMVGIDVYSSFESDAASKTGIIPLPKKGEQLLGGHAILAIGYDDTKKWVICRNSWGETWGDAGYFYLPYTYFTKGYASDFWVLQN
jgi:C1A family cysteine protease